MYFVRFEGFQHIVAGQETTLRITLSDENGPTAPSDASFALYDATGAAIVAYTGATVTTSGATYTVLGAATSGDTPSSGCYAVWACDMLDGESHFFRQEITIAHHTIYPCVLDEDLIGVYPELAKIAPPSQSGWGRQRLLAWKLVSSKLLLSGYERQKAQTHERLFGVLLAETLVLVTDLLRMSDASRWSDRHDRWVAKAASEWDALTLDTDEDQDGIRDDDPIQRWTPDTSPTGAPATGGRDW